MKTSIKKAGLTLFAVLFSALCFAEEAETEIKSNWKNSAGLSIDAPWSNIKIEDNDTYSQIAPRISALYSGGFDNGFCVQAKAGVGAAFSEDFKLEEEGGISNGINVGGSIGAGWNFNINERFSLAALGLLSLDWTRYKFYEEITAKVSYGTESSEWKRTSDILSLGIGGELSGKLHMNDHISMFASLGCQFIDFGFLKIDDDKQNHSYDSYSEARGNFILTPGVGVLWTF